MTALGNISDLINRATGGNSGTPENLWFFKNPAISGTTVTFQNANQLQSLWLMDGWPGKGSAPGAVAVPDNTTAGGLLQADPGGGRQKWLTSLGVSCSQPGTLFLYDRLLHISGLSGTSTSAQTVGGSLTRYTTGAGNMAWIEVYTAIGTTARTVTMSYSNTTPTSGRTSTARAIGGTGATGSAGGSGQCQMFPMPLQAGDTGVSAVASFTLSASTGTAGDIGLTIGHPLAFIPINPTIQGGWRDFVTGLPGIPEILTDACLALAFMAGTTSAPAIFGSMSSVEA